MSDPFHPSTKIPVIETERLKLRGLRRDDFSAYAAMWADPAVTRYIAGNPFTPEEAWARLLRHVGHWSLMGFGFWAIEEKTTGAYIGELGFEDFKRDIEPSLKDVPEIGWGLVPSMHGKGYAAEAVRAAIAWGESHLESARTACIIRPENLPSIRVAEKCGYREFQQAIYKGQPMNLYVR